ncbi:MAG: hypothetical protein H7A46_07280 [Verrucomicrobiales bacterium]|nr:hypothetical protein [Verrucomicrobiales bacterium]
MSRRNRELHVPRPPATPAAAHRLLQQGNAAFARLVATAPHDTPTLIPLLSADAGSFGRGAPRSQEPFAAVLGCSDARVPLEIIFQQACNDLFVVRVAGNILTSEGLGSLDFAATAFARCLRLLVVLGHTRCGAVTAAVDAFLAPMEYLHLAPSQPLRGVLDRLFIAVRAADRSLREVHGPHADNSPGYRAALIECSVILNAALTAHTLARELGEGEHHEREIVFGIYDLESLGVWSPPSRATQTPRALPGMASPPATPAAFRSLGKTVARMPRVLALLDAA